MTAASKPGLRTRAVHAGQAPDPATGARVTPIHQSAAYVFRDVDHAARLFSLDESPSFQVLLIVQNVFHIRCASHIHNPTKKFTPLCHFFFFCHLSSSLSLQTLLTLPLRTLTLPSLYPSLTIRATLLPHILHSNSSSSQMW